MEEGTAAALRAYMASCPSSRSWAERPVETPEKATASSSTSMLRTLRSSTPAGGTENGARTRHDNAAHAPGAHALVRGPSVERHEDEEGTARVCTTVRANAGRIEALASLLWLRSRFNPKVSTTIRMRGQTIYPQGPDFAALASARTEQRDHDEDIDE
eukprot:6186462-Pleurochrysis_carterae.AAC.2